MMEILETFIQGAIDTLFVLIVMVIAKQVRDARFKSSLAGEAADAATLSADHQIEEESNLAVGLRRAGLSIGFGFGLAGVVSGGVTQFSAGWDAVLQDTGSLLLSCGLLLVFLFIAELIAEHIILRHVNNSQEIYKRNIAVGLTEFGVFAATGLVAYGSFSGDGGSWHTSLGFFALGQTALILFAVLYEWSTPFKCVDEIRNGNQAAGLMLGGAMITLGIILSSAIAGPFTTWTEGIIGFAIAAGVGMALLIPFQKLIDIFFLPNTTLEIEVARDQNIAACAVTVCTEIALAIMIGALVAI